VSFTPLAADSDVVTLIADAKTDRQAMGELMVLVRPYLLAIANSELDPVLKVKVAASDLVQQSINEAIKAYGGFCGRTAGEFRKWTRQILRHNLLNWNRHFRQAEAYDVDREVPMAAADSQRPQTPLIDRRPSPVDRIERDEELDQLYRCLAEMPTNYRQVLDLRHWREWSFEAIGELTGQSPDAARMAYGRALDHLKKRLGQFQ